MPSLVSLITTPLARSSSRIESAKAKFFSAFAAFLAAILSCAYSYEIIAKNIVKHNPSSVNDSFYGDWIKGYASDGYAEENVILLEELNCLTENYTEEQIQHLVDIFVACSRYELAFWEMSWTESN